MAEHEFTITRRVEFSETDAGGIVHFTNFFRYMEYAEHAFFRSLGRSIADAELDIGWPRTVFPVNSVKAMRGCFVAEEHDKIVPYSRAVFASYWGDDRDISQDDVLRGICAQVELDADELLEKVAVPSYKERLKASTQELMERGGFGTPTTFVNGDDMYFGNDRIPLIRDAIKRAG